METIAAPTPDTTEWKNPAVMDWQPGPKEKNQAFCRTDNWKGQTAKKTNDKSPLLEDCKELMENHKDLKQLVKVTRFADGTARDLYSIAAYKTCNFMIRPATHDDWAANQPANEYFMGNDDVYNLMYFAVENWWQDYPDGSRRMEGEGHAYCERTYLAGPANSPTRKGTLAWKIAYNWQ